MDTGYSKWRKLDNAALAFPLVTGKDEMLTSKKGHLSWSPVTTSRISISCSSRRRNNGDKIGQGRENAKLFLKEHPDLMEEVEQKVREKYAQKEGVDQVENEEKASDKTVKEPVKAAKKADDAE